MKIATRLVTAIVFLSIALPATAFDVARQDVSDFIDEMVTEHDYDRDLLLSAMREAKSRQTILDAISRPAERTLTWAEYRKIFITEKRINAGVDFWREHEATLRAIAENTGVPCEILVGIIGVETFFGRITGNYRVLDALATLAFDYPPRSKFFRRELAEYLLLVREEGLDATNPTGSYAGAMGAPQFMPSSFRAYAVDASSDGRRDIWDNWTDVIGSVANYFVAHKWRPGEEVVAHAMLASDWTGRTPENSLKLEQSVGSLSESGVMFATELDNESRASLLKLDGEEGAEYWVGFHNFFVITRYNRSVMYALAVHQLGEEIALARGRERDEQ
ncbi:MAG: lytic murein transglycosylase B [Woeseia sp.]|nr:lytic murein transglycosylase B [Woeseia sp.]